MNLVAKEFVAAQDPADPGVLVLSRLAGAAAELGDGALLVNPYDPVGVADAILRAAEMPPQERREKHAAMMRVLRSNDIHAWRRRFVDALGG
jgi:trehalose 6-phosphate synthase